MFGLEHFFARLRQWHTSRDSIAFLGSSKEAIFFLSSSNLVPRAWVTRAGVEAGTPTCSNLEENGNRASSWVTTLLAPSPICLAVVATCCQRITILTDDEVISLVCLSKAPFVASIVLNNFGEEGEHGGGGVDDGRDTLTEEYYAGVAPHNVRIAKCLGDLLQRAHGDDCLWRGRRPLQMLFGVDSLLNLEESVVVRARCAPVQASIFVPQDLARDGSLAAPKPRSRLLMPRASPPSFLTKDVDEAFRYLALPRLTYVGSNTNERILDLFFPPVDYFSRKRAREGAESRKVEHSLSAGVPTRRVSDVCLLLHLYGYILEKEGEGGLASPLPSIDGCDTVEALERRLAATDWGRAKQGLGSSSNKDVLEKDSLGGEKEVMERARALIGGWHFCCRFCGGKPPVCIDEIPSPEPEDSAQASSKTVQNCILEPVQSDVCTAQPAGEDGMGDQCEKECPEEVHDAHSQDREKSDRESPNEDSKDLDPEENKKIDSGEVDEVDPAPASLTPIEQSYSRCSSTSRVGVDECCSPSFEPKQRRPSIITTPLSVREALNGHRGWCPWKNLFLNAVLKGLSGSGESDGAEVTPLRCVYMDFCLNNSKEGAEGALNVEENSAELLLPLSEKTFRRAESHNAGDAEPLNKSENKKKWEQEKDVLRFQLVFAEMERLATVWRTSQDIERRFRHLYLTNPYPEKVLRFSRRQPVLAAGTSDAEHNIVGESSSSVVMEAFLSNLQKRLDAGGKQAEGAGIRGPYQAASIAYWPAMMVERGPNGSDVLEKLMALVAKTLQALLGGKGSTGMPLFVGLGDDSIASGRTINASSVTSTSPLPDITGSQLTTLLAEGLMLLKKMSASTTLFLTSSAADASSKRQEMAKQCADFIARMDRECLSKTHHTVDAESNDSDRDQIVLNVLLKLVSPIITLLYHDYFFPSDIVKELSKGTAPLAIPSIESVETGMDAGLDIDDGGKKSAVRPQTSSASGAGSDVGFSNGGSSLGWFWNPTSLAGAKDSVEAFLSELRRSQDVKISSKTTHEQRQPSTKVSGPPSKFSSPAGITTQKSAPGPSKKARSKNKAKSSSTSYSPSFNSSGLLEPGHRGGKRPAPSAFKSTILTAPSPAASDADDSPLTSLRVFANPAPSTERKGTPAFSMEPSRLFAQRDMGVRLPTGAQHPPTSSANFSILGSNRSQQVQPRLAPQHQSPYQQFQPSLLQPLPPTSLLPAPISQESFAFPYPSNTNEFQPSLAALNEGLHTISGGGGGGAGTGAHNAEKSIFSIAGADPNAASSSRQDPFSFGHRSPGAHAPLSVYSNPGNNPYCAPSAHYSAGLCFQESQGILDGEPSLIAIGSERQLPVQPHWPRRGGGIGGRHGRGGGRGGTFYRGS